MLKKPAAQDEMRATTHLVPFPSASSPLLSASWESCTAPAHSTDMQAWIHTTTKPIIYHKNFSLSLFQSLFLFICLFVCRCFWLSTRGIWVLCLLCLQASCPAFPPPGFFLNIQEAHSCNTDITHALWLIITIIIYYQITWPSTIILKIQSKTQILTGHTSFQTP